MSYATVVAGMHERFATVPSIKAILDYEPQALHTLPALYSLLDRYERSQGGQVTAMKYRILHRLCVRWQANEKAEVELMPFVNSLAAAVDADPTLGGRVASGYARVTEGVAVFVTIGGTLYRALDVYSEVVEKAAYQSGI